MNSVDPIEPWVDAAAVRKLARGLLMPIGREVESVAEDGFGEGFVGYVGPQMPVPEPARPADPPAEARSIEPDQPAMPQVQEQARESLAHARERAEHGGMLERPAADENPRRETAAVPVPPAPAVAVAEPGPADPPAPSEETQASLPDASPPSAPEQREAPSAALTASSRAPFVDRLHAYGQWLRSAVQAKAFFVTDRDGHVLIDQVRSPKLLQVARTLAQASHAANRHAGAAAVGSLHVKLGEASILEVLSVETSYGLLILGIVVPGVLSIPAIPVISRGLEQVVGAQPA